ncbi:TlpA family protein disulfide reductase [Lishizhenia tianjinensis]|nr:hypothetical protein [Lishizhenia tianjinensis]
MKYILSLISLVLLGSITHLQAQEVYIEGYAQNMPSGTVEVYEIVDYLTRYERKIGSGNISADSTFNVSFPNIGTQKIKVKINNNYFYTYVQPNAKYDLYVKDKSPYNPERPEGNLVEYFFGGLPETDINYKIIEYDEEILDFLRNNFRRTDVRAREFMYKLDTFNIEIREKYKNDTSSYFEVYRRYGLASLDDLSFIGASNRLQKFDFYLKPYTVSYTNDRYMEYFLNFYENFHYNLSRTKEQVFYNALLQSSPTLLMNALGNVYEVKHNLRVRELVLINMMSDLYYNVDYPQVPILNVLDSLAGFALFEEHKEIAKNMRKRLTELKPGVRSPNFEFTQNDITKQKGDYLGKYHYVSFVNTDIKNSMAELELLRALYLKYGGTTQFTTFIVNNSNQSVEKLKKKYDIQWEIVEIKKDDDIIHDFQIQTFPQYVLIDIHGYIVAAPALGPKPNGEYKTIERQLHAISRLKP